MLRKEILFAKLRASDFGLSQLNDAQRGEVTRMSAFGGRDAMRLKDAASSSFDYFHIDLKERPDDTVSSIELQRTVYL